jgi:hypothetical protein
MIRALICGLAAWVLGATAGQAAGVSIAAVLAHPAVYADKTLELSGEVDQCTPGECHLCLRATATVKQACIMLREWAFSAAEENDPRFRVSSLDDRSALNWATPQFDQLFRFSQIKVTAKVRLQTEADATRSLAVSNIDLVVGCSSSRRCINVGDVWLEQVAVTRLITRRSALAGLLTDGGAAPVGSVSSQQYDDMVQALEKVPGAFDHNDLPNVKAYADPRNDTHGWICNERDGRYNADWPTKVGQVENTQANPYRCWAMQNYSGSWELVPDWLIN